MSRITLCRNTGYRYCIPVQVGTVRTDTLCSVHSGTGEIIICCVFQALPMKEVYPSTFRYLCDAHRDQYSTLVLCTQNCSQCILYLYEYRCYCMIYDTGTVQYSIQLENIRVVPHDSMAVSSIGIQYHSSLLLFCIL